MNTIPDKPQSEYKVTRLPAQDAEAVRRRMKKRAQDFTAAYDPEMRVGRNAGQHRAHQGQSPRDDHVHNYAERNERLAWEASKQEVEEAGDGHD